VLRDYSVDGRLLLIVKSLYSCLNVCVRVGLVKPQPFAVSVGLGQGCMLPPLLFIIELDKQSQPRQRVSLLEAAAESNVSFLQTIGHCLHFLNKVFNMHSIGFLLCATKPE